MYIVDIVYSVHHVKCTVSVVYILYSVHSIWYSTSFMSVCVCLCICYALRCPALITTKFNTRTTNICQGRFWCFSWLARLIRKASFFNSHTGRSCFHGNSSKSSGRRLEGASWTDRMNGCWKGSVTKTFRTLKFNTHQRYTCWKYTITMHTWRQGKKALQQASEWAGKVCLEGW